MSLITITPPAVEPVSMAEAKEWCRVETLDTSQDVSLANLIKAARERAESITGRAFIQRTVEQQAASFPGYRCNWGHSIQLEVSPAVSITSITYRDADGAVQTLDAGAYFLDAYAVPSIVWPTYATTWPSARLTPDSLKIRYVAGYAGSADSPPDLAANMPAALKLWMQTMITTRFNARDGVIPGGVTILPDRYIDSLLDDLILGTRFG